MGVGIEPYCYFVLYVKKKKKKKEAFREPRDLHVCDL